MITPIIKVKANIILVTCGLLILMIHMAMNQHQSGGRCDRLLQVTLTARFSIDPLSLYPHIHYTIHIHYIQNIFISTSKSFFSLPLYPYTHPLHPKHIHLNIYFLCSTGSNVLQFCDYPLYFESGQQKTNWCWRKRNSFRRTSEQSKNGRKYNMFLRKCAPKMLQRIVCRVIIFLNQYPFFWSLKNFAHLERKRSSEGAGDYPLQLEEGGFISLC